MTKYAVDVIDAGVTDTLAVFDTRFEAERFLKAVKDYHESIKQPINVKIREVKEPVPMDILVISIIGLIVLVPALIAVGMGAKRG
jgi:hypothetical protein